jgi:hypothetical protein
MTIAVVYWLSKLRENGRVAASAYLAGFRVNQDLVYSTVVVE